MYLTGYHGTDHDTAMKILDEKKFIPSNCDSDWLGCGIYFYFDFKDALNWRGTDSIIHSLIVVDEDKNEYLDLTTADGQSLYLELENYLYANDFHVDGDAEKRQCAVINQLWRYCPNIKAIAAEFATERTKIKTLLDFRKKRKELCVRDNNNIIITHIINREDVK